MDDTEHNSEQITEKNLEKERLKNILLKLQKCHKMIQNFHSVFFFQF
jgi:hypothetical protein